MMRVFIVIFVVLLQYSSCSTIIDLYSSNQTSNLQYPGYYKDISDSTSLYNLQLGASFNSLTVIYGKQNWEKFTASIAIPTVDLCRVKPENVIQYITEGDALLMPKFWGCSREFMSRKLSQVPQIKALLHYDTADVRAYGFSQSFTDGSDPSDITIICLLIPKQVAAALTEAIVNNYIVEVELVSELATWSDMPRVNFLVYQIVMLLVAIGVVVFSLYRLSSIVYNRATKRQSLINISVFVIFLETVANIVRLVLYATLPNLSGDGIGQLSYPAWRILITFTFPIECLASTALILYWHELLLMKMKVTKLAFMTNIKSKIGFGIVTVGLFATDWITSAMDASAYDVSFFIVIALCVFYMLLVAMGTYYVGYKVLKNAAILPQIRTITIKLMISVSFVWVIILGAILQLTPLYWSVVSQAWMIAIVFIGLWGLSVSHLVVFKHKSANSNNTSSGSSERRDEAGHTGPVRKSTLTKKKTDDCTIVVADYVSKNVEDTPEMVAVTVAATVVHAQDNSM